jgi:transposase
MRKSIDGLRAIVQHELEGDAFTGHLFVFVSRRGDRVKILTWDKGGFVLYYKRLERGHFRLPHLDPDAMAVEIDATQLSMLLDAAICTAKRRTLRRVIRDRNSAGYGALKRRIQESSTHSVKDSTKGDQLHTKWTSTVEGTTPHDGVVHAAANVPVTVALVPT